MIAPSTLRVHTPRHGGSVEGMSHVQIEAFRVRLAAQLRELESVDAAIEESAQIVDLDAPIGRLSRIDAIQQQKMAQSHRRRSQVRLQQTMAALSAIKNGKYGICRRCDDWIGIERLDAMPESPICVDCQIDIEENQ